MNLTRAETSALAELCATVRTGVVASSHNRLLGGFQRARELADYDAAVAFSADDATAECEAATAFRDEMLALLGREGWLAPTR